MKFLSIAIPFTSSSSSNTRKGQAARGSNVAATAAAGPEITVVDDVLSISAPVPNADRGLPLLPPVPPHHHRHQSTRSNSTPPTMEQRGDPATAKRKSSISPSEHTATTNRKSILRSTSRTSLKRAMQSTQSPPASTSTLTSDPSVPSSTSTLLETVNNADIPQRRRRKSFREIFSLPSTSKVALSSSSRLSDQSSGVQPHPSDANDTPQRTQKAKRRFSIASSPSSSSINSSSPTSPAVRKSLSTTSFREANQNEQYIPPVPPLPTHLSLEAISPLYPSSIRSSTLLASPHTPITSSHNIPSLPGSAHSGKSTSSSVTLSSPNDIIARNGKSLSYITRSSSVPALYTSAALTASPSSSTASTLATPQTVDLRSPAGSDNDEKKSNSQKKQQLSPLLLGPCLSDSLLSPTNLLREDILDAFATPEDGPTHANEDILSGDNRSEDGYGSESHEGAMSTESDDYGAASNASHGMTDLLQDDTENMAIAQPRVQLRGIRSNSDASSRRAGAAAVNTLRVDTSLASASSTAIRRTSGYIANSPASLSPYVQSFPSNSISRQHQDLRSASPASTSSYRRTPTPTLATHAALTPSPRALSQGAKICLDYTMYRLRRDGSASSSTQPEKVNILSSGGRRYPSSTRPYTTSTTLTATNAVHEYTIPIHQLKKEPKSASMDRELAYIGIMKKLQMRKRLTLMEEVELDGFKRLQATWTPCSSPLQIAFTPSVPSRACTDTVNVPAARAASPLAVAASKRSPDLATEGTLLGKQKPTTSSSDAKALPSLPSTITTANVNNATIATSAFVSCAFMTAQQLAWRKWISRMSFEESKTCFVVQDDKILVLGLKTNKRCKLLVSDRAHAWAQSLSNVVENATAQQNLPVAHPGGAYPSLPKAPSPLSGLPLALSTEKDHSPASSVQGATITKSIQGDTDMPPFMKNRISVFGRRTASSSTEDQASISSARQSPSSDETPTESPEANPNTTSGSKNSFGHALASKFGFRSGKNKVPSGVRAEAPQCAVVESATSPLQHHGNSSGSSMTTTGSSTRTITPTTSASSTCSDQRDVDATLKARDFSQPARPERSTLRPPREEKPRPSSMVRSATTQALLSTHAPSRPSSMLIDGQMSQSQQQSRGQTHTLANAQSQSAVPRSQSEQHIHTYRSTQAEHANTMSSRRISLLEGSASPQRPQRRVRVVSQPAGVHTRPHSLYSTLPDRDAIGDPTIKSSGRPSSQLLQVPRRSSMIASAPPHANHQVPNANLDDDELPLATLRHATPSSSGSVHQPSSREGAATPEARPRLRSAMRSASQPRPSSMYNTSNRRSVVLQETQPAMPRPHSFANNRLSAYDMPIPNGGYVGNGMDYLKNQIKDEQLLKDQEAVEVNRRREQRKVWEDHRRRSVYLDDKAAAAEKAANEATRRQSHLYMTMAMAQANPQPPYHAPMGTWAASPASPPHALQPGNFRGAKQINVADR